MILHHSKRKKTLHIKLTKANHIPILLYNSGDAHNLVFANS